MQLAELGDRLQAAQERFDYPAIEALCEQNRALRPQLSGCLQGLKSVVPKTDQERELVALALPLVKKVRQADKSFAIWQANLGAMRVWSADGAAQSLLNVTRLCEAAPVDTLDNRFKGVPAVVVAAGPSLDRNLHLLHEVMDKAVVITMNRCASIFQGEGLTPHLLVASERSEALPEVHLKDIDADVLENFVVRPSVHPRLLDVPHHRRFVFTDGSAHEEGLMTAMGKSARPVGGGTVGHTCFLLAYHMGCDPIVLIGQDLAYSEGKAYSSKDLDADKRLVVGDDGELGAVCDAEGQAQKIGIDYDFQVEWVPGWGGGEVATSIGFRRFIDFYDVMVDAITAESPEITLINATEGGAHLEGMRELPFRDVIDQYIQAPQDALRSRIAMLHGAYEPTVTPEDMAATVQALERHMVRLHNLAIDGEKLASGRKRTPRRHQRLLEIQQRVQAILTDHEYFLRDAYRGKLSEAAHSEDPWDIMANEFRALRSAIDDLLPGCRQAVSALASHGLG